MALASDREYPLVSLIFYSVHKAEREVEEVKDKPRLCEHAKDKLNAVCEMVALMLNDAATRMLRADVITHEFSSGDVQYSIEKWKEWRNKADQNRDPDTRATKPLPIPNMATLIVITSLCRRSKITAKDLKPTFAATVEL